MRPDEARETVAAWADAVAPESLIAVTVARFADPELWERVRGRTRGRCGTSAAAETAALFAGMVMLPPGVGAVEWGRAGRVAGAGVRGRGDRAEALTGCNTARVHSDFPRRGGPIRCLGDIRLTSAPVS